MEKLEKEEEEDEGVMMNLKEIEEWRGIWIGLDLMCLEMERKFWCC